MDQQLIAKAKLTAGEYQEIVDRLGREPNPAELGMFGVMWSEHCCYKNSRPLLRQFPTTGDRILVGPGENAGVVDFGQGIRVAFKIESHNHPSAVEPFQGAATGVGGILRDIFTMGARPIALLNSLRFGSLREAKTRQLFSGVVEGIAHYGNCVGVPTIGGEVYFDPAYADNPLVNAMAIGLMETPEIVKAGAAGLGNPVLYVGSTTGRDGMGGASFASTTLQADAQDDRPAVQVGDPFLEKALIEACLEAFQTGYVVAAQDMGAAGITCSTSEMAAKGGVGIEFDLDQVPAREPGMTAYEYLLSESQERMLLVAEKGKETELIAIFQRWGLHAVVAGEVIAEPVVRIKHQGRVAALVPAAALAENTPICDRIIPAAPPAYAQAAWQWQPDTLPLGDWQATLLQLLDSPNIASKQWVYRQYDHQVQNNSLILPGQADAAVIRLRPQPLEQQGPTTLGLAATVDCNSRYVYLHPYRGAKAAVAEAARNLSCVGAEPLAVTDNLNFGNPEKPVVYWQLSEACRGLAEGCEQMQTPVTGGNVSLYNETNDTAIYPTPVVGMVGIVHDISRCCGQGWRSPGDLIYLLGANPKDDRSGLAASEYLAVVHNLVSGLPPDVDWHLEKAVQTVCRNGINQGWIKSAHDCSEGGLAVALAEGCITSGLGADIQLPSSQMRPEEQLFGEWASQIIVSVGVNERSPWEASLQALTGQWLNLGQVKDSGRLTIRSDQPLIDLEIAEMADAWSQAIPSRMTS